MKTPLSVVRRQEIQRRPILVAVAVILLVGLTTSQQRSFFGAHLASLVAATQSSTAATPTSVHYDYIPETSAHACTDKDKGVPPKELLEFLSQQNANTELMSLFGELCGGTYLEMSDERTYSNSFVFHQLGWKGIVIDDGPRNYVRLIKMSGPDEVVTVHAAVCKEGERIKHTELVKCKRLADLMSEYASQHTFYDFFSLDALGGEYKILQSVDFGRVHFGIIFAQSDRLDQPKNLAVRSLLEMNGYIFLERKQGFLWFMNRKFALIYKDLV